jgi:hypothetical protein
MLYNYNFSSNSHSLLNRRSGSIFIGVLSFMHFYSYNKSALISQKDSCIQDFSNKLPLDSNKYTIAVFFETNLSESTLLDLKYSFESSCSTILKKYINLISFSISLTKHVDFHNISLLRSKCTFKKEGKTRLTYYNRRYVFIYTIIAGSFCATKPVYEFILSKFNYNNFLMVTDVYTSYDCLYEITL